MDKIKVMALGGLDEEGKDLYIIEVNNDIFVVNAGFKYPDKTLLESILLSLIFHI